LILALFFVPEENGGEVRNLLQPISSLSVRGGIRGRVINVGVGVART
jgi:hypothetical protein